MVCGRQHRGRSEGLLHPEGEHIPFPGTDCLEAVPHGGGGEVEGLLPLRELIARLAVAVRMNEAELVVERNER